MDNDYIFKVRTSGDIIDLEGRVIGHINLEYIKSIAEGQQGEWKGDGFVFCNQCGCSHGTHKTNFCPNCGAKMKKEKNNG